MKRSIPTLLAAVALASAGATYLLCRPERPALPAASAALEEARPEGSPALEVADLRTARALPGQGWDTLSMSGRVVLPPERLVRLGARIEGRVVEARLTIGDRVQRGERLASISSVALAEARAQHRQARARLAAAREAYGREARVVRLGGLAERPVEEARIEHGAARGDLAAAQGSLAQARSEVARSESELAQCKARLARARDLYGDQIVSRQDLETAETEHRRDSAAVEAARSQASACEARVAEAQARVEVAARYVKREQALRQARSLDTRALQGLRSAITSARLEVDASADRIRVLGADPDGHGDTTPVVSPIAGRVVARRANMGQMVVPADELYTIADLSNVWVEAEAYERDLSRVVPGQVGEIRLGAVPGRVLRGQVASIGDILDPETRTARVRLTVANPEGRLRAGMFAQVHLVTARRGSTVLVPREAVLDDAGRKVVFIPCTECDADRKAGASACGSYDRLEVTVGPPHGSRVEVLAGLAPGTLVVTQGQYQIKSALGSGQLKAGCADEH